jgi:asparagine synthase (glutamine-hydrolysing)
MVRSYLGGVRRRDAAARGTIPGAASWTHAGGHAELALFAAGVRLFTWDALALLVRGYVRPSGTAGGLDLESVAEEIRCHYLEHGELAVDGLDGSFTLALLDGMAGRALLYRNLVGTGFTYYHADANGLLFGGNLADLVDASGVVPRPNRDALPAFFLYRWVPGRATLFDDFFRLLPGEEVCWDARGLTRVQRHGFADVGREEMGMAEAVERVECTLGTVLADCACLQPGAANLLSGGIDSTYLQALWNRVTAGGDDLPPSWSVHVDHPHTWADTDYAVTASRALGTRHVLVPAEAPYADYLLETLAETGEPPNHVQSAYFGRLAREMASRGVKAGLCGEGADSLFGLGLANKVHNAGLLRRLVPGRPTRGALAALCGLVRWQGLAAALRLANDLYDPVSLEHPANRVAAFADWEAVAACFGPGAAAAASAGRRTLLDRLAVSGDPMDRLHAAGFLGEAMDSASLWATLFDRAGGDLLCPFLDSRVVRLALGLPPQVRYPFRRPKELLKRALGRHVPAALVQRPKLGFGQPIFEWLAPGGQLRPLVERIGTYPFVDPATLARTRARPTWFLYSLLCYDLWHKLFIERSLPRPARPARREVSETTSPDAVRVRE